MHPVLAKENGISERNGYGYQSLLDLFGFFYVDDKGVSDCKAMSENLSRRMPDRLEIIDSAYVVFTITVEQLCPRVPALRGAWSGEGPGP